jgi:hypothetical protein
MAYFTGAVLALTAGGFAIVSGFDRGRSYYPTVLIVVASYYCLFAVLGGSNAALWRDAAIMSVFAVAAVVGFRTSLWVVVAGLFGHGAMDFVHHFLTANPGVPAWWPGFCAAFDITAAGFLAARIKLTGEPAPAAI